MGLREGEKQAQQRGQRRDWKEPGSGDGALPSTPLNPERAALCQAPPRPGLLAVSPGIKMKPRPFRHLHNMAPDQGPQGTPGSGLAIDPLKTREVPQHLRLWSHVAPLLLDSPLSTSPTASSWLVRNSMHQDLLTQLTSPPPKGSRHQSQVALPLRQWMSWPFYVLQTNSADPSAPPRR